MVVPGTMTGRGGRGAELIPEVGKGDGEGGEAAAGGHQGGGRSRSLLAAEGCSEHPSTDTLAQAHGPIWNWLHTSEFAGESPPAQRGCPRVTL